MVIFSHHFSSSTHFLSIACLLCKLSGARKLFSVCCCCYLVIMMRLVPNRILSSQKVILNSKDDIFIAVCVFLYSFVLKGALKSLRHLNFYRKQWNGFESNGFRETNSYLGPPCAHRLWHSSRYYVHIPTAMVSLFCSLALPNIYPHFLNHPCIKCAGPKVVITLPLLHCTLSSRFFVRCF